MGKEKKVKPKKTKSDKDLEMMQRYQVWQELLVRPEGVSYEQILDVLAKRYDDFMDYAALRKMKPHIEILLKLNGYNLKEIKTRHSSCFFVEADSLDIVKMVQEEKVAQPYMAMLDMLSKCRGLLPESFLQSLCDNYQKMSENVNVNKSIAFDSNYECMSQLDVFPIVYSALNKYAIWVSFHPVNKLEENVEGAFFPEFLKQHNSNWYAFGMFLEEGKSPVFQKIPLNNIDNYNDEDCKSLKFIKSPVEDYEEYFGDIIGVENPEANKVETVKFRISNRMFQRLLNRPIHPTLTICKELDCTGFKGMKMSVKYNIELMREILKLGSEIEIVEPEHIRKRVVKDLKKALSFYEK